MIQGPAQRQTIQVSSAVVLAAYRRGISVKRIAVACGVSHQAIDQRLKLRGIERGGHREAKPYERRVARICPVCGSVKWVMFCRREEHTCCSSRCNGLAERRIADAEILRAMQRRLDGWTWTRTARTAGCTIQALQFRIWMRLYENRRLTEPEVQRYWYRSGGFNGGRPPAWNWLQNDLGIVPSTDGGARAAVATVAA